jgi:hypothetical protein
MKPISKNIITKGILGLQKAISLITKGLLDELKEIVILRGQRKIKGYAFDLHFNVIGQKAFSKVFAYYITGTKLFEVVCQFALKAKKSIQSIFNSLIQATVSNPFALKTSINGQVGRRINSNLNISGIKSIKHNAELEMAGILRTSFSQENYVTASKSFTTLYTSSIKGTKQTNVREDIKVKGMRDITPILVALDLIN